MTNHEIEVLGLKLKAIRQKRGFTQAQLAELVDCSNTYICLLEKEMCIRDRRSDAVNRK